MGDKTEISWTDATWNPVRGCSRVSPGCGGATGVGGCYAEKMAARFSGPGAPYEGLAVMGPNGARWTGEVRLIEDHLSDPIRWTRPRRIFVNSMSDLFHEKLTNEEIAAVFGVMAVARQHTFQVLTKRPARMKEWFHWLHAQARAFALTNPESPWWNVLFCVSKIPESVKHPKVERADFPGATWPLPNVHLGVSVESQKYANERIPLLLQTPAAVRFLSCEPLLGPVDVSIYLYRGVIEAKLSDADYDAVAQVIVGGESGPGARPMHPNWARSLRDQCVAAGVPYFFKQHGEYVADPREFTTFNTWVNKAQGWLHGAAKTTVCIDTAGNVCRRGEDMMAARDAGRFPVVICHKVGKKSAGRLLDGKLWDEFPKERT